MTAATPAPERKAGALVSTEGLPQAAILTVPGEAFDLSDADQRRIGRPVLVMRHLLPRDRQLRTDPPMCRMANVQT